MVKPSAYSRADVWERARALGWPRVTGYGTGAIEGSECGWKSAAMPFASDRRALMEQLEKVEQTRSAGESKRKPR